MWLIIRIVLLCLCLESCGSADTSHGLSFLRRGDRWNPKRHEKALPSFPQVCSFTDGYAHTYMFFPNGYVLDFRTLTPEQIRTSFPTIEKQLYRNNIRNRRNTFSRTFVWGLYTVKNNFLIIELSQKVQHTGFLQPHVITAKLNEDQTACTFLPSIIDNQGVHNIEHPTFYKTDVLDSLHIDPTKSWISDFGDL
jgi:hypothetical protein